VLKSVISTLMSLPATAPRIAFSFLRPPATPTTRRSLRSWLSSMPITRPFHPETTSCPPLVKTPEADIAHHVLRRELSSLFRPKHFAAGKRRSWQFDCVNPNQSESYLLKQIQCVLHEAVLQQNVASAPGADNGRGSQKLALRADEVRKSTRHQRGMHRIHGIAYSSNEFNHESVPASLGGLHRIHHRNQGSAPGGEPYDVIVLESSLQVERCGCAKVAVNLAFVVNGIHHDGFSEAIPVLKSVLDIRIGSRRQAERGSHNSLFLRLL
jgi:hypothetical protein